MRPKLQLALDMFDLPSALRPLQKAHTHVDIIEVGTILCLSEGMHAVRAIKALYPEKIVLADVRIAEAGSIIAKLCYDAGADWVTVVSGAAPSSAEVVLEEAKARGRDMQIELSDGWTWQQVEHWRNLGVEQIISKRSRDSEAQGNLSWQDSDFETIKRLHDMGYKVSVAGSVTEQDLPLFAGVPVYAFIVGRSIAKAAEPGLAARSFQTAIAKIFSEN